MLYALQYEAHDQAGGYQPPVFFGRLLFELESLLRLVAPDLVTGRRSGRARTLALLGERVRDAGKDKQLVFPDWNSPTREDRSIVYNKGGYVIHLMREAMGDEAFWNGLRLYTTKFRGRSVTTADFLETMQSASPKDLSTLFKMWVYLGKS